MDVGMCGHVSEWQIINGERFMDLLGGSPSFQI
jgi:hypothetical protein